MKDKNLSEAGKERRGVPSAETKPSPELSAARCKVCGWPLRATVAEGCVEGNCSMRPVPHPPTQPTRSAQRALGTSNVPADSPASLNESSAARVNSSTAAGPVEVGRASGREMQRKDATIAELRQRAEYAEMRQRSLTDDIEGYQRRIIELRDAQPTSEKGE